MTREKKPGRTNKNNQGGYTMKTNTCKTCGSGYDLEDVFAELFGDYAPASNDKLCPTCEAEWIETHKNETYNGE